MRKIKPKPFKLPKNFKPPEGSIIRYVTPIEAAVMAWESYEQHDRERTWNTIMANLRGEPVTPTPNYFDEVPQ